MKASAWGSLVLLVACGACATLEKLLSPPKLNLTRVDVRDPGLEGLTLDFVFDVENPNPIGAKLDGLDYSLEVNSKEALKGGFTEKVEIPATGKGSFRVPVQLRYLDAFESLRSLVMEKSVLYRLSGEARFGPFRIPLSHEGSFAPPKLPSLSFESVRVEEWSLESARLVSRWKIENPNSFPIPLEKIRYIVRLNAQPAIEGTSSTMDLAASRTTEVEVPLLVSGMSLLRGLRTLSSSRQVTYELDSEWLVKSQKGPTDSFRLGSRGLVPVLKR